MLSIAVDGPVAWWTLDRPKKRNALSPALLRQVVVACEEVARRDDVRVVVLRGAGGCFSAGADLLGFLPELNGDDPEGAADVGRRAAEALAGLPQPTIAQVHGACVGGGVVLSSACDLVVAADTARFRVPEVDLGIPFAWGGTTRLARIVGPKVAADWVLTCRWVEAEEALARGFVSRVVSEDALAAEVEELAKSLADKPRRPLAFTKDQIARHLAGTPDDAADGLALLAALKDPETMAAAQRYVMSQVGKR